MTRRCYAHYSRSLGRGRGLKTYQVTSEANTTAMSAVVYCVENGWRVTGSPVARILPAVNPSAA
jgi:hypothetical protein